MNLEENKQVEMLTSEDVATILNIPKSRAYTIIRKNERRNPRKN